MSSNAAQATSTSSTHIALQIPEILHLIFSFAIRTDEEVYSPNPHTKCLFEFILVNSVWSQVAKPLIYRHLTLGWRPTWVQPLLDCFANYPSLPHLVQSYIIKDFDWTEIWDEISRDVDWESFMLEAGYSAQDIVDEWDQLWGRTETIRNEHVRALVKKHKDYI